MKHISSVILLIFLVFGTIAQELRTIEGRVVASDNDEALIGVNIFLSERWDIGTITNLQGEFSLQIPTEVLQDTIIFSYVGHKEKKVSIVNLKKSENLKIVLFQNSTTIQEVVVKAERLIAEEFTLKKVRKLEIYTNPNAKADPLLAVNSLPAATTTDESANISLRGSGSGETGIFFNNVPVYDAVRFSQLNGIGTFSIFNTTIVKSLDVFPGNPPLEYGNTTSGLIAISSEEQIPKENNYSLALSMANIGMSANMKTGEKSSLIVFSNYGPSGLITAANPEALRSIKKFGSVDLGLHYYIRLNNNTHLKVFNYSIKEWYEFNLQDPTFTGTFQQRKSRNYTIGNFRKTFEKSEFTANGGFSISQANFNYSKSDFDVGNQDVFGSINYQYFGRKFGLKAGLSLDDRVQNFDGTVPVFAFAIGEQHPFIESSENENTKVLEYYSYAKYYLNKKWIVGVGMRKNIPNENQENYLSSQLNIFYAPSDKWKIKTSIGEYNKYTFTQNQGAENFLIRTKQADININRKGKRIEYNIAVFVKDTEFGTSQNSVFGVEYFLAGKITKQLKGRISYTYIKADISDKQVSYPSRYDLNYFIKGNLAYQLFANWTLTTTFLLRQGTFYQPVTGANFRNNLNAFEPITADAQNSIRYPRYNLIDLSVSRIIPVNEDLTIIAFATLGNVFDFKNVRGFDYNFDYSQRDESLFSRRLVYFGAVFNF